MSETRITPEQLSRLHAWLEGKYPHLKLDQVVDAPIFNIPLEEIQKELEAIGYTPESASDKFEELMVAWCNRMLQGPNN